MVMFMQIDTTSKEISEYSSLNYCGRAILIKTMSDFLEPTFFRAN